MSTNTIDPFIKISHLERLASDSAISKADRKLIISDMNKRTKVELGEMTGKPAKWCKQMWDLEMQYGLHKIKMKTTF